MDISQEFGLTNEIFYKETFAAYITVYFLHVMTKLTHILLKFSSLVGNLFLRYINIQQIIYIFKK